MCTQAGATETPTGAPAPPAPARGPRDTVAAPPGLLGGMRAFVPTRGGDDSDRARAWAPAQAQDTRSHRGVPPRAVPSNASITGGNTLSLSGTQRPSGAVGKAAPRHNQRSPSRLWTDVPRPGMQLLRMGFLPRHGPVPGVLRWRTATALPAREGEQCRAGNAPLSLTPAFVFSYASRRAISLATAGASRVFSALITFQQSTDVPFMIPQPLEGPCPCGQQAWSAGEVEVGRHDWQACLEGPGNRRSHPEQPRGKC